jgi:hypothetical protein
MKIVVETKNVTNTLAYSAGELTMAKKAFNIE